MPQQPRALAALVLCAAGGLGAAQACTLVLSEHRSATPLMQVPLDAAQPRFSVAFTHSVLGTPVQDHYEWRADAQGAGRAVLVAEVFEGEGYGLPSGPAPGERWQRVLTDAGWRWRLDLQRPVHPLVVRPLPAQHMRVEVPGMPPILLGQLTQQAVLLQAQGCGPARQGEKE